MSQYEIVSASGVRSSETDDLSALTSYADTLGDIIVYCASEARRWGIPLSAVLSEIMASMDSKLVDGKPIYNEEKTKFIKGPDYIPPEPSIRAALVKHGY